MLAREERRPSFRIDREGDGKAGFGGSLRGPGAASLMRANVGLHAAGGGRGQSGRPRKGGIGYTLRFRPIGYAKGRRKNP